MHQVNDKVIFKCFRNIVAVTCTVQYKFNLTVHLLYSVHILYSVHLLYKLVLAVQQKLLTTIVMKLCTASAKTIVELVQKKITYKVKIPGFSRFQNSIGEFFV